MLKFLWFCLSGVAVAVIVLAGLYLPGTYTDFLFWLPFLFAFFSLGGALFLMNDRKLGHVPWRRFWEVLRVLPRSIQIGFALALLGTISYQSLGLDQAGADEQLAFERSYATISLWICTVGATFTYGWMLRQRGGEPPRPGEEQTGWVVNGVVWTIVVVAAGGILWHYGWTQSGVG